MKFENLKVGMILHHTTSSQGHLKAKIIDIDNNSFILSWDTGTTNRWFPNDLMFFDWNYEFKQDFEELVNKA